MKKIIINYKGHSYIETAAWWNPFSDVRCRDCNKPFPYEEHKKENSLLGDTSDVY